MAVTTWRSALPRASADSKVETDGDEYRSADGDQQNAAHKCDACGSAR